MTRDAVDFRDKRGVLQPATLSPYPIAVQGAEAAAAAAAPIAPVAVPASLPPWIVHPQDIANPKGGANGAYGTDFSCVNSLARL